NKIRLLGYDDDLDIIGDLLTDTVNAVRVLEEAVKRMGLKINSEKTKIMEHNGNKEDPNEMEDLT
ncbi:Reverse transcriptase domain, partial [Cinara cedri]